jgi:enamine deaminase RidA (YjgF/YER057c/UK114 family)
MARRALEPENFPFFDYRRFTFSLGIVAGGSVWLSGNTAARFDPQRKGMVVNGDLIEQAGVIFDKMQTVLAAGGRKLTDVTRMVRYVTPRALPDLGRLDAVQREIVGSRAEVATVEVHSLLREEALIEIEAAVQQPDARLMLASAQGEGAPDDIVDQTRGAYRRIAETLTRSGIGFEAVVKTTEFIVPAALPDYRKTAAVRRDLFSPPYPAATGVIRTDVSPPRTLIAVEAIAVREA